MGTGRPVSRIVDVPAQPFGCLSSKRLSFFFSRWQIICPRRPCISPAPPSLCSDFPENGEPRSDEAQGGNCGAPEEAEGDPPRGKCRSPGGLGKYPARTPRASALQTYVCVKVAKQEARQRETKKTVKKKVGRPGLRRRHKQQLARVIKAPSANPHARQRGVQMGKIRPTRCLPAPPPIRFGWHPGDSAIPRAVGEGGGGGGPFAVAPVRCVEWKDGLETAEHGGVRCRPRPASGCIPRRDSGGALPGSCRTQ